MHQDLHWDHGQASARLRPTSSNCLPHHAEEHLQNMNIHTPQQRIMITWMS